MASHDSDHTHIHYIVDCGSGHTELFKYGLCDGALSQLQKLPVLLRNDPRHLRLCELLSHSDFSSFFEALRDTTADDELFLKAGQPSSGVRLLVGATGGVRKKLEEGAVSTAAFEAALALHFPESEFKVLTGDEEARLEFHALPSDVALVSGGGISCQLVSGDSIASIHLDAFIKPEHPPEESALAEVFAAEYKSALSDVNFGLRGKVLLSTMQAWVAEMGSFADKELPGVEALSHAKSLVEALCRPDLDEELRARLGAEAQRRKKVLLVAAVRLQALLESGAFVLEEASCLFTRCVPGTEVAIEWSAGAYLGLVAAEL